MQQAREKRPATGKIYYGYIVVALSLVILTLTYGTLYTFGVFLEPLIDQFGWTRAGTSFAYSLSMLVSGILGIFAGNLSDRLGSRTIALIGGICLGLGFLLTSRVNSLWQLYLLYGTIIAAGIGGCWPVLASNVARWFTERRGIMTGIILSGVGFGMVVVPPVTSSLVASFGWRIAYMAIGATTLVLITGTALFLKKGPPQRDNQSFPSDFETLPEPEPGASFSLMLHSGKFWILAAIYFCFGYFQMSVMVHIVAHATGLGTPATTAATLLAVVGIVSIVAKILAGAASDRIGIYRCLLIVLGLMSLNLFCLQAAQAYWMLAIFCVFFGIAYSGIQALQSLVIANIFGLQSLGLILGSICFFFTIGGASGSVLSGYIYDITGSYSTAFYICAFLAVIAFILAIVIKPRH